MHLKLSRRPLQNGLEWRSQFRHSRMLLAGIQAEFGLDPRLKHSGVTPWNCVARILFCIAHHKDIESMQGMNHVVVKICF